MDRASLLQAMSTCEQTSGMTILQHGEMVRDYYQDLMGKADRFEWRLPDWIDSPRVLCDPLAHRADVMGEYHLYHDCGKPSVRTDDGRFPDHAAASARLYLDAGGSPQVYRLIGMDMDVHTLKSEGLEEFASRPEAIALLLTGLAEVHANASMFGGLDSTSFKIKWKHLNKRGRQILALTPPVPASM